MQSAAGVLCKGGRRRLLPRPPPSLAPAATFPHSPAPACPSLLIFRLTPVVCRGDPPAPRRGTAWGGRVPKRPSVGRQWRGGGAARRCAVRRGATAGAQCGRHGGGSDKCCGGLWDTPVATGAASSWDGRGGAGRPAASPASPLAGGAGRGVGSSHGARRCPHFSSCFLALPLCACVGPPRTCSRCSAGAPAAAARSADPRPSTAAGVSGRWR